MFAKHTYLHYHEKHNLYLVHSNPSPRKLGIEDEIIKSIARNYAAPVQIKILAKYCTYGKKNKSTQYNIVHRKSDTDNHIKKITQNRVTYNHTKY